MTTKEQGQDDPQTPKEIEEVKEEVSEQIEEIQEQIEEAETPEDIAAIEAKIEGLKQWLTDQIATPLTTLQTQMTVLSKAVAKLQKKEKVITEAPEQPEPEQVPEPEPKVVQAPVARVTRL